MNDPEPAGGRVLAPLYAAGFVTAFGAHAVAANLGGYGAHHHVSLWELGLLLGVYDGAEVVLKPVFGAVADRVGAKPVLVGGLIGFAGASALFVIAGSAHWLGAARLAQGSAAAAFSPAASATVAALGGAKRTGRLFGGYGGVKGVGYLLGPILGGAIVAAGGYRSLFAVLAALAAVVAVLAVVAIPHVAPARRERSTLVALVRQVTDRSFLGPVVVLAGGTAALSAGVGYLPVLGAHRQLGPLATGAIVTTLGVAAAIVQPWAGRAHDRASLPANAGAGAIALCASGFGVALAIPGAVGVALGAVIVGCGIGLSTPVGFAQLAATAPQARMGRTMGAAEVGRELGDAGGPLLAGTAGLLGLNAGLAGLAAALLACAGAAAWLRSVPRARAAPSAEGPR